MTTRLRNLTLTTSALTLALLLTACGGTTSTQGVMKAGPVKSGFMGLSKTADLTVTKPGAFKGKTKVVIGSFVVGFDVEKADSKKAGGGLMGNGFGGKSSAYSKLGGVDNATFAAITEAAYKDFVKKLQAAGYDVVSADSVLTHADFAKVTSYENPYSDSNGGLLTARSETRYFTPAAYGKNRVIAAGDIGTLMGGFASSSGVMGAATYAEKTGVPVLAVAYKIDFANAEGHGSWASQSSSLQLGQGLTLEPGSRVSIVGGYGGTFSSTFGNIALGQPITSDKSFADVVDKTTGTDRGMQIAGNVLGVMTGVGTNSKRNYEVSARPADYKAAALETIEQANANFTAKMASLR